MKTISIFLAALICTCCLEACVTVHQNGTYTVDAYGASKIGQPEFKPTFKEKSPLHKNNIRLQ